MTRTQRTQIEALDTAAGQAGDLVTCALCAMACGASYDELSPDQQDAIYLEGWHEWSAEQALTVVLYEIADAADSLVEGARVSR